MKYARNLIWGRSEEGNLSGVKSDGLKHPGAPSVRPRGGSEEAQFTLLARTPKSTLSFTQARKWVCSSMGVSGRRILGSFQETLTSAS